MPPITDTDCLTVRLSALGDAILTTGVLEHWRRTRGLHFHILTRAALAPVFAEHPAVRGVIAVDTPDLRTRPWLRLCRELATRHGRLPLIDLHANLRTSILRAIWPGPKRTYAKLGLTRRLFLATRHPLFARRLRAMNVPQRYSLALDATAPDMAAVRPVIFLTADERAKAASILTERALNHPIAIHPFATHMAKTPPAEVWRALVRALRAEGRDVVILGRADTPLFPNQPFDLTNATDLRLTAAVLAASRCLISGDSGPMHLATAVGAPCIALFGPTTREWGFYPSGPHDIAHQSPCPDAPCSLHGQDTCTRDQACMNAISSDLIRDLIRGLPHPD